MRANVSHGVGRFGIEVGPRPRPGPGLVIRHEPVGVIDELGLGVTGYHVGDRVLVGAITLCGQCDACLSGHLSQCGYRHGHEATDGWRFGNTKHGAQAEYLVVPNAQANLATILVGLTDEQIVLLADNASTGIAGAERRRGPATRSSSSRWVPSAFAPPRARGATACSRWPLRHDAALRHPTARRLVRVIGAWSGARARRE